MEFTVSTGKARAAIDFRDFLQGKAANMDEQRPRNVSLKGEPGLHISNSLWPCPCSEVFRLPCKGPGLLKSLKRSMQLRPH